MSKLSDRQYRQMALAFGIILTVLAAFFWTPAPEPMGVIHYGRAFIFTVGGIYFLFKAITGDRASNKKSKE
jgi:hypothetical protein